VTKADARILFLRAMAHLIKEAEKAGIRFLVYTFYRTQKEQDQKVAERRSQVKFSQHQDWLAIDIVLLGEKDDTAIWNDHPNYHLLGEIWKAYHPLCRWGGRFEDGNHYSLERDGIK